MQQADKNPNKLMINHTQTLQSSLIVIIKTSIEFGSSWLLILKKVGLFPNYRLKLNQIRADLCY